MVFPIAGGTQDTGYEISNSLRFNSGDSPELTRTFGSAGGDTWSYSCWLKRGEISQQGHGLLKANTNAGLYFLSTGALVINDDGSSTHTSTELLRDPNAWYHILFTGNGTTNKVYVNNSQLTFSGGTPNIGDINNNVAHSISKSPAGVEYMDGYLSEIHFVDGTEKAPTDFAEFNDNGVWIPKKYTGTYGTNGFFLEFKQTGTSANSSGMGADTSGNDNHFTPNNLAAIDVTTDTPQNNFATLNPLYNFYVQPTLSEGNCKVSHSSAWAGAKANMAVSKGKWYWEIKLSGSTMNDHQHGVQEINVDEGAQNPQNLTGTTVFFNGDGGEVKTDNSSTTSDYGILDTNDILGVALNMDGGSYGQITYYDNGSAIVSNANLSSSADYVAPFGAIGNSTAEYNFGNPSFSISSGNADANGYGNFEYAPPSGYYSLCTKNLAEYG